MSKNSGLALVVGTVTGLVGGFLIGKNWGTIKRKVTLKLLEATNVAYDPFEDFDGDEECCGSGGSGNNFEDAFGDSGNNFEDAFDGFGGFGNNFEDGDYDEDEENYGDTFF